MATLERLPYQIHRAILSASPTGTYYEHDLVDERDGRIIHSVITRSPIAPEQMRKWQANRNSSLLEYILEVLP